MGIKENLEKAAALFGDLHEPKRVVMAEESKQEIIGNDFDIANYEFSDKNIIMCKPSWIGDDIQIEVIDGNYSHHEAILNKDDAIAIAKALGVTADDLI